MEIYRGHIYRAKKPKRVVLFFQEEFYDDRQVLFESETQVQYDSLAISHDRKYPTVGRERFEKWAGSDVTNGYPEGDWARWGTSPDDL